MNHTRGPWFLINDHCVGGPIEPGWEEAGCGIAHCGMRARTRDEAKANATLISAAPDMYEALEAIRDFYIRDAPDDEMPKLRQQIIAALEKADGYVLTPPQESGSSGSAR